MPSPNPIPPLIQYISDIINGLAISTKTKAACKQSEKAKPHKNDI